MHEQAKLVLNKTIGIFGEDLRGNHMFDYRLCLTAMLHVQNQINVAHYAYTRIYDPEQFLLQTARNYPPLKRTIGICGHQVHAFITLIQELGYKGRDVQIYHLLEGSEIVQSHVVAEVFFGDAWRMFDVTWGWHPYLEETEQVMSYNDILSQPYKVCQNELDAWTNTALRNQPAAVFGYTKRQDFGVLYDLGGTITLPLPDESTGETIFGGVPKFIGSAESFNGETGANCLNWVFKFTNEKVRHFHLKVGPIQWRSGKKTNLPKVHFKVGNKQYPFSENIKFSSAAKNITVDIVCQGSETPYSVLKKLSYITE